MQKSLRKQDTIVPSVAKKLPPFQGTFVDSNFIAKRIPSWQAHLQRISPFLQHGENVWWKSERNGYRFFDSDSDAEHHPQGPNMLHFSQAQLTDVGKQQSHAWDTITTNNVKLPSPYIRLYDKDGNFTGNKYFTTTAAEEQVHNHPQSSDDQLLSAPQISPEQVPQGGTALESQLSVAQTNHEPVATPVSNSTSVLQRNFTPSLASLIQPVTLFKPHYSSPSECPPQTLSMEVSTCTQESGKIHENDDDDQVPNDSEYHTKAAKLIQKCLGQTSELDTFDKLRAVMKEKMH